LKPLLYKKIAGMIAGQIEDSTFLAGDRLPSIRQLSRELRVSIGTVQQAYASLEDQGLILPRHRSGFYVRPPAPVAIDSPEAEILPLTPKGVNVLETAISVMRSAARGRLIQMGSAIPNVKGSAVLQLHRELKRHAHKIPNYEEDPQGYLPLRRQLAKKSIASGSAIPADRMIVTAGCQEALTIALRCIAGPGDIIAVESPCYYGMLQALEVLEIKVLEIPASPTDGITIGQLEASLKKWPVKGVLLNPAFSNPTGYRCPDDKKKELVRLITAYDIPLIEDDVFAHLSFSGPRPRSIQSYDPSGRVILCSSISKILCPDLRIGWMAPGRYMDKARALKFVSTLSSPCHTQFALATFLSTNRLERHIRAVTREYAHKQRILLNEIKGHFPRNTRVTQPRGGFLCWVRLPEEIDGLDLYHRCLEKGITVAPGEIFSSTRQLKNYIRLNYAVATIEQIQFSIRTIAGLIRLMANTDMSRSP
jgi:DNA-binding transcriptional MocR family regulator